MLSSNARFVLGQLQRAGFEAYAVGGCVRDILRGVTPSDIDITTNALPEDILCVFKGFRVIPTGLRHGTVTVLVGDEPFEVTTYRTDGIYSDGRHPDSVRFTTSLEEDLARRDFTINAMAMDVEGSIVDPFGGKTDLVRRVVRCVGDARTRFTEDALRIMRLCRFMSVLDFDADSETARAAQALCDRLDLVAAERKRVELMKMLTGDGFLAAATALPTVLCRVVPALAPLVGFDQKNPHHQFDIYTHTMRAVHAAEKDPLIRLAVLLHDIGKPATFSVDEKGVGHFFGHPAVSETLARQTLLSLHFDNATIDAVLPLVRNHDIPVSAERKTVKRRLSRLGVDGFRRLLAVKTADAAGCFEGSVPPDYTAVYAMIDTLLAESACFSLEDLAVSGRDLIALGIKPSPLMGEILHTLLDDVIAERYPNDRDALLATVKERWL